MIKGLLISCLFLAPEDYASTNEMIDFFFDPVTVSIPIVFDSMEELNETFTVSLMPDPDQNLVGFLFSPDVATITILGKYFPVHNYMHHTQCCIVISNILSFCSLYSIQAKQLAMHNSYDELNCYIFIK